MKSNQTVVEGRDAEFYCRIEAFPIVTSYRWFKDGNQIFASGDYAIDIIFDGESKLTIKQAKKSSTGQYSCDGENNVGIGGNKSAFLSVNCK